MIDIVNKPLPKDFYVSGSPTMMLGLPTKMAFGESRVIVSDIHRNTTYIYTCGLTLLDDGMYKYTNRSCV